MITYINLHAPAIDAALADPRIFSAIQSILGKEGGLTNDANDAGGITNDGISLRYAQGIGLDLNGDGQTTAADILLVTRDEAARLYAEDFFTVPKTGMLPDCLWPWQFDFQVNSGPPRAIMILQRTLNYLRPADSNSWIKLVDDGVMGKNTAAMAAMALSAVGFPKVQNTLCDARQGFLNELVAEFPKDEDFINGWTNRVNSFRVAV